MDLRMANKYSQGYRRGKYVRNISLHAATNDLDSRVDEMREARVSLETRIAYANGFWDGYHGRENLARDDSRLKMAEVPAQVPVKPQEVYVLFPMKSSELHHVLDRCQVFTSLEAAQAAIPDADWVRDGGDHWLNINVDAQRAFIVRKNLKD